MKPACTSTTIILYSTCKYNFSYNIIIIEDLTVVPLFIKVSLYIPKVVLTFCFVFNFLSQVQKVHSPNLFKEVPKGGSENNLYNL